MRIAMWSGPRNISTALMYAFAARSDCAVWDEPFYAAYLATTGIDHPLRDQVIAAGQTDPAAVATACAGLPPGGKSLWYQKHMTMHMVEGFPLDFMHSCVNIFLIRHPARVVASYARKREDPTLHDIGFVQQAELFDRVADWLGLPPPLIDSDTIRSKPRKTLENLCAVLGITFEPAMLSWPAGPKPYDGVWAPHWYGSVHASTGFEGAEGPLPDLPPDYQRLVDQALPYYDRLLSYA